MNNTTIKEIKIKLRGDHVYDIYCDKIHFLSAGSVESALDALKILFNEDI